MVNATPKMTTGTACLGQLVFYAVFLLALSFSTARVHGRAAVPYKDNIQEEMTVASMINAKSRIVRAVDGVPQPAVINGSYLGDLNWMVSLQYPDKRGRMQHFYGGCVVSNRLILTAAHCLYVSQNRGALLLEEKLIRVRFGGGNMSDGSGFAQIDYLVLHRDYNHSNMDRYVQDDIDIIRLKRAIRLDTERQGSITFGPADSNLTWHIAGWGLTERRAFTYSQLLKQAVVHYATPEFCQEAYPNFKLTDRMVCTHSTASDICQGDSGGPLFTTHSNPRTNRMEFRLIGVSSGSSQGCGMPNSASVFTKVGPYLNKFIRPAIDHCRRGC